MTDRAVGRRLINSLDHINSIGKGHMEEMQRLRAEAASAGAEAKDAGLDDPIPEEAQALRQRNIDAMLGNT